MPDCLGYLFDEPVKDTDRLKLSSRPLITVKDLWSEVIANKLVEKPVTAVISCRACGAPRQSHKCSYCKTDFTGGV